MTRSSVSIAFRRLHRARLRLMPFLSGAGLAGAAIAIVAYLLWPTWHEAGASAPNRIPVSIGATLFNVPARAFRMKVQTHSGPQDRVDLAFAYPSLTPPEAHHRVSADSIENNTPEIDRLFLSIVAHDGSLAPDLRARTIYPRYFEPVALPAQNGLLARTFRAASPYADEDLFYAATPALIARCTRDGATAGMCLSERRDGDADLTFRFPRAWLGQWRNVANAMDTLTAQLQGPRSAAR